MRRRLTTVVAAAALVTGLAAVPAAYAAECVTGAGGGQTCTGEIDGAPYRVEVPADWNGRLLLYSHGYFPDGFPDLGIAVTNQPGAFGQPTEDWLLEHGYALAASNFDPYTGYFIKRALRDQIALLDWFESRFGRPRHTVATGSSLGAAVATQLAAENPGRFSGVATFCGGYDPQSLWNVVLDSTYVVKHLLAPGEDIDLVRPRDPDASYQALSDALDRALLTPRGRARVALAAAMANVPGWYSAKLPEPALPVDRIRGQQQVLKAMVLLGTYERVGLEQTAGGNPSSNAGVDYARQLARSAYTEHVERAYTDAGLNLRADLATLGRAPRHRPDPAAVRFMHRYGVQSGQTPVPVITLHSVGDAPAVADQERWYAERVQRNGNPAMLRQLYVRRGGHCSFSAADELATLEALFTRIGTGHWPELSPQAMNTAVSGFGAQYQLAWDWATFSSAPDTPKFTDYNPPKGLRPSA
ncbi:MAG: DUF6351 family protein [Micromonosporaceae bacterium]